MRSAAARPAIPATRHVRGPVEQYAGIRVLCVDDHPVTRQGIEVLLRGAFRSCQVWGVAQPSEVVRLAEKLRPDLILLDLRMSSPPSSAEICKQLLAHGIKAPISILTAYPDDEEVEECLAAGARGCLLKEASPASLVAALRRMLDGEQVLDPRVADALAKRRLAGLQQQRPVPMLTSREREVLELLAEGLSNRAIGDRLVLAETTVKWHVRRIMTKLEADSRWQAVVIARQAGVVGA
ncbi:LuxR C-terminal-related transcriptional regulator [Millisia brevis]|uniref:LuxR C-terminal-related transcriptional regulator n=1 Tax=Millisia brevis TaxID=264148 RepID=UPI0008374929|nr:response regulator transcription factor [Millisia brevis]